MDRFDALLAELGKPTEVAAALGVTPQAVTNMRARRSVAPDYWPKLIELAASKGFDLTEGALMAMYANRLRPAELSGAA